MTNVLDASSFNYSRTRKDVNFEFVLTKCIIVYNTRSEEHTSELQSDVCSSDLQEEHTSELR